MDNKFNVVFTEDAKIFIDNLEEKARDKIIYNIWKSRIVNDNELFKKLEKDIWEFRTLYKRTYYRLFAFWDKTNGKNTIVVATHGIIKKSDKIHKNDIEKAEMIMKKYFEKRKGKNENI